MFLLYGILFEVALLLSPFLFNGTVFENSRIHITNSLILSHFPVMMVAEGLSHGADLVAESLALAGAVAMALLWGFLFYWSWRLNKCWSRLEHFCREWNCG